MANIDEVSSTNSFERLDKIIDRTSAIIVFGAATALVVHVALKLCAYYLRTNGGAY